MAFSMAAVGILLVMVVLASQRTPLQARSMPGDYDTQQYVPTQADDHARFASQDASWEFDATHASFATRDIAPPHSAVASTYNYDKSMFATSEAELPFDTFVDSPEIVQDTPASFAHETTATHHHQEVHTQAEYENDQVFFDTSNAETVYRGNDDGLSLSAADVMNATTANDMLATPAEAMGGCGTGNPIDDCRRCDPNWRSHRQALAFCAIGFGINAIERTLLVLGGFLMSWNDVVLHSHIIKHNISRNMDCMHWVLKIHTWCNLSYTKLHQM